MSLRSSVVLLACLAQIACASGIGQRLDNAQAIAKSAGMMFGNVEAGHFRLATWHRPSSPSVDLVIYNEGDGLAWISRNHVSSDPTPVVPVALQLAAFDSASAVYLARPCQFTAALTEDVCRDDKWWTGARFSEAVIAAFDQAIDTLKIQFGAQRIHLVGYSGGAAVAVLVAARRNDIASLRTVAGNLDHVELHARHKVSQLPDSLNPVDYAGQVSHIPQLHFIGLSDTVIPPGIAQNFLNRPGAGNCAQIITVQATHSTGWKEQWPRLLATPFPCNEPNQS